MIKLFPDGSKEYYNLEGQLHRLSGPALIYKYEKNTKIPFSVTIESWFYNDMQIPVTSQKEFERYLKLLSFI